MKRSFHLQRLQIVFILTLLCTITINLFAQPRVVSLSPTLTEIVYAVDAADRLIGVTKYCDTPEQVLKDKETGRLKIVGGFVDIDIELVVSLKPDLVLTDTYMQRHHAKNLRDRGIKVLHYEPKSLEEVFKSIEEIGGSVGKGEYAKQMTDGFRKEITEIQKKTERLPRVKVYMELNHDGPWTMGSESPLNDIVRYAGGVSIFEDVKKGVFIVKHEDIINRNPEVILSPLWPKADRQGITILGEIYKRQGYEKTTAYENSRILYYDSALLKHEGPRQIIAIKRLAYILHPLEFECPSGTVPWELGRIK